MLCIQLGLTMYSTLYLLYVMICLIFYLFSTVLMAASFHFHDNRVYSIGTCPVSVINYTYCQVLLWKLSSILNVTTYRLLAWSW